MLNVGGRPFLDTLIDEIARYSTFEEILLPAGHRAEPFLARYSGAVRGRARPTSLEQPPLGTAGALAHAASPLQKRFLFLNGASFFDFNLLDLVWRGGPGLVHMALRTDAVGDRSRHVVLDNDRVARSSRPATAPPVRPRPGFT
jgi:D-glycero-D-manno-heptose 1,7-bisphosphate phosphatase